MWQKFVILDGNKTTLGALQSRVVTHSPLMMRPGGGRSPQSSSTPLTMAPMFGKLPSPFLIWFDQWINWPLAAAGTPRKEEHGVAAELAEGVVQCSHTVSPLQCWLTLHRHSLSSTNCSYHLRSLVACAVLLPRNESGSTAQHARCVYVRCAPVSRAAALPARLSAAKARVAVRSRCIGASCSSRRSPPSRSTSGP